MNDIKDFAEKYIRLYKENETPSRVLDDPVPFADDCFKLGFTMDCGEEFIKRYSDGAFYNSKELQNIIDDVDDTSVLCNAIFSKWRYITHWSYGESVLDDDNKKWFLIALNRLILLFEEE